MLRLRFLAMCTMVTLLLSVRNVTADFPSAADRRLAQNNGWIYDDFEAGLKKAKSTGKPMMVVLRCPP